MQFFFILISILMVIIGGCALNAELYEKMIRFKNDLGGIKTEISPTTLSTGRLKGIVAIIVGLIFLYVTLVVVSW